MTELGKMYKFGQGVEKDAAEAVRLFRFTMELEAMMMKAVTVIWRKCSWACAIEMGLASNRIRRRRWESLFKCKNICCSKFDGRMRFLRSDRALPALENIRSQMLEVGKMNRMSMYVAS